MCMPVNAVARLGKSDVFIFHLDSVGLWKLFPVLGIFCRHVISSSEGEWTLNSAFGSITKTFGFIQDNDSRVVSKAKCSLPVSTPEQGCNHSGGLPPSVDGKQSERDGSDGDAGVNQQCLMQSGDIETNPGPSGDEGQCKNDCLLLMRE